MKAHRPRMLLAAWVTADLLSVLGTRLAALAVPWLVLTTTGSATKTGLVAAAELAPMVIARAMSGPLLDRWGAVRSAVVTDAVSAVAVVCVPLLWASQLLSFPALVVLVAVLGAARGPGDSAKQVMLPDLARVSRLPLERVTGIGGTTERLASTAGLALGGVVVALVGGAAALGVTAAGFAASAALGVIVLRPALKSSASATPARATGYLVEFVEGFRGLRRDRVLVGIVTVLALTNAIDQAFVAVLLPAWVIDGQHGPQTLGWLLAAFMVAAVAGSLVATAWSNRLPRLPVYVIGLLVGGAPRFVVLALGAPVPVVLAVMVSSGLAGGFINPVLNVVTLERAPLALRGRVLALIGALSVSLTPLGGVVGGVLTDRLGLPATLWGAGVVFAAVAVLLLLLPSWRDFGHRSTPHDETAVRSPPVRIADPGVLADPGTDQ